MQWSHSLCPEQSGIFLKLCWSNYYFKVRHVYDVTCKKTDGKVVTFGPIINKIVLFIRSLFRPTVFSIFSATATFQVVFNKLNKIICSGLFY